MSTTFAVITKDGTTHNVARRVGRGVLGAEMWFTDPMAELLSDETEVVPTDNSAQGIHTIGDIRAHIRKQEQAETPEEVESQSWIKDINSIKVTSRKSIFVPMTDVWHKEHDFVEVTEWTNGEGWDIVIGDEKQIALHFTEFEVIKELIAKLEND